MQIPFATPGDDGPEPVYPLQDRGEPTPVDPSLGDAVVDVHPDDLPRAPGRESP